MNSYIPYNNKQALGRKNPQHSLNFQLTLNLFNFLYLLQYSIAWTSFTIRLCFQTKFFPKCHFGNQNRRKWNYGQNKIQHLTPQLNLHF